MSKRIVVCAQCGEEKEHYAKELCRQCYAREHQKTPKFKKYAREWYHKNKKRTEDYQKFYHLKLLVNTMDSYDYTVETQRAIVFGGDVLKQRARELDELIKWRLKNGDTENRVRSQ